MLSHFRDVAKDMFGSEEACLLGKFGGKVNMILWHENMAAITDSMGTCRFMHASFYAQYPIPELLAKHSGREDKPNSIKYHEWLSAATGMEFTYEDLLRVSERIISLERALNTRFGIRRKDDTLPERFFTQPLPSGPYKGAVFPKKTFDSMIDQYYDLRGWDKESGLLVKEKLLELSMKDVASDLQKRGLLISKGREEKGS